MKRDNGIRWVRVILPLIPAVIAGILLGAMGVLEDDFIIHLGIGGYRMLHTAAMVAAAAFAGTAVGIGFFEKGRSDRLFIEEQRQSLSFSQIIICIDTLAQ